MINIYISMIYSDFTQNALTGWALSNQFDLNKNFDGNNIQPSEFEFHTTVFYTDIDTTKIQPGLFAAFGIVKPKQIKLLGNNNDIPALIVEGKDLFKRRRFYEKQYRLTDSWPQYVPHISLSYGENKYDETSITTIPLPSFPLIYDKMLIRYD